MSLNKSRVTNALQGRGGFSIVPNELWRLDIPTMAKTIWAYLLSQHPEWDCSRNNIARNLGIGRQTVTDLLNLLSGLGMVKVDSSQKSWAIEMVPPSEWKVSEIPQDKEIEEAIIREEPKTPTGLHRDRSPPRPVLTETTSKKREEKREKFSQEDIYRKWLAEVPERPDFKACYEELLVLFESLRVEGFSSSDLSSSFRKRVLARWERSKYPERHATLWDKALGATFSSNLVLAVPEVKEGGGVKIKRQDGQISLDTAIAMTTDDDIVERMMRDYDELGKRPNLEGSESE